MWCGGSQVGWPSWNLTIYNIIPWFAGPMGQTTRPPSVWPSKYFFLIISYRLIAPKTLYNSCNFIKKKKIKKNCKSFCKEFCKILWKNKLEHQTIDQQVVCPIAQRTSVLYCKLTDFWLFRLARIFFWSGSPKKAIVGEFLRQIYREGFCPKAKYALINNCQYSSM